MKKTTSKRIPPILAPAPRTEPISIPGRDPVPVTLLTGFLGAGKTTLLNRILNGQHGLRVGVLVNDFGAINIDAELVEGIQENMISLTNGCVCCEIRDDLVESIEQLLTQERGIDYVIVEASGVADPGGIMLTFLNEKYENLMQIDSVTCVIDAEGIFADGDNEAMNILKLRQIGFADLVVLNKVDLVGPEHLEVIREWIEAHMTRVRVIECTKCNVPLDALLAVGRFAPSKTLSQLEDKAHRQDLNTTLDTWNYESEVPFDLDTLREMVRKKLPEWIYRCKGIIYLSDYPDKKFALQIVGRRTEISEISNWESARPVSRIVAIGSKEKFDKNLLSNLFESCSSLSVQLHN